MTSLADILKGLSSDYRQESLYPTIGNALISTPIQTNQYTDPWTAFGANFAKNFLGAGVSTYGDMQAKKYDSSARNALLNSIYGTSLSVGDMDPSDMEKIQSTADMFKLDQTLEAKAAAEKLKQEIAKEYTVAQLKNPLAEEVDRNKAMWEAIGAWPQGADQIRAAFGAGGKGSDAVGSDASTAEGKAFKELTKDLPPDASAKIVADRKSKDEELRNAILKPLYENAPSVQQEVETAKKLQSFAQTPDLHYGEALQPMYDVKDYLGSVFGSDDAQARREAKSALEGAYMEIARKQRQPGEGTISNYDAETFQKIASAGVKDPESAVKMAQAMQAAAERKAQYTGFADWYLSNVGREGLTDRWAEYVAENPIFDPSKPGELNTNIKDWKSFFLEKNQGGDIAPKAPSSASAVSEYTQTRTLRNSQTGEVKVQTLVNGKWQDR